MIPDVDVNEGGGGAQTLCHVHHLRHKHGPRVGGLIEGVRAEQEGLIVGDGVGRRVRGYQFLKRPYWLVPKNAKAP